MEYAMQWHVNLIEDDVPFDYDDYKLTSNYAYMTSERGNTTIVGTVLFEFQVVIGVF